ncbi:hypothetical protein HDIA_4470 [Hartmannibacter diazotrophicus]|uniref:Uncharacterized protein n=1 Tax=Hartmannibacter diazotrophicus TaxID=1482074 RepID=A0A2C9DE12_9HYPH|nr:hypothetical protein [Hartmannibacter diazotrophicus]SON58011.1 hypothetical protein HDIA_4470 [Hartmannibacter diazotrophicus]
MARVDVSFFMAGNRSAEGGSMPVPRMTGMVSEVLTSGGTSVATATTSEAPDGAGFVRILTDGDVWAVAGAAPVASAPSAGASASGILVKAYLPYDLAVAAGDKIAVIDV